jgi:hypothetical protein
MREVPAILLLGVAGLILVYGSVVVGEVIATTTLAQFLRHDVGIPVTLFRMAILSVTTLPVAYVTASGLIRWAPVLGLRATFVVALLFTLVVGWLQVNVYQPSTLGASLLKVAFVVVPLAVVAHRHRSGNSPGEASVRARGRHPGGSSGILPP